MLLCDFMIDNEWAMTYAEVRKLCALSTVTVNGEVENNYQRPVLPGDKITCGRRKESVV